MANTSVCTIIKSLLRHYYLKIKIWEAETIFLVFWICLFLLRESCMQGANVIICGYLTCVSVHVDIKESSFSLAVLSVVSSGRSVSNYRCERGHQWDCHTPHTFTASVMNVSSQLFDFCLFFLSSFFFLHHGWNIVSEGLDNFIIQNKFVCLRLNTLKSGTVFFCITIF